MFFITFCRNEKRMNTNKMLVGTSRGEIDISTRRQTHLQMKEEMKLVSTSNLYFKFRLYLLSLLRPVGNFFITGGMGP